MFNAIMYKNRRTCLRIVLDLMIGMGGSRRPNDNLFCKLSLYYLRAALTNITQIDFCFLSEIARFSHPN